MKLLHFQVVPMFHSDASTLAPTDVQIFRMIILSFLALLCVEFLLLVCSHFPSEVAVRSAARVRSSESYFSSSS